MSQVGVAVVGLGYWGPNLVRAVAQTPGARLAAVCDTDAKRREAVGRQFPSARQHDSWASLLADPSVDAVVLATPADTHFRLAGEAMESGRHVLVEKPLASTSGECRRLVDLAAAKKRTLMVGHIFRYNAAVRKLKEYIDGGELGDVHYIYSSRLALGRVRQDCNALWNFAPHDISIVLHLLGQMPAQVNARGWSYLQPGIEDVVFVNLTFPSGTGVNIHLSWLDPRKVRLMTVVGSRKMVVYDDVDSDNKLALYDKGVTKKGPEGSLGSFQSFGEFQLLLRAGDVLLPKVDFQEPLQVECRHFVDCVREGRRPDTDGLEGLAVVQVLEAAQRSLKNEGRPEVVA